MSELILVRVNCPDKEVALRLADSAIANRLAACANIQGPLISIYEWEGEIERAEEWVVWFKTTQSCWPALEAHIAGGHPYEVPAILSIPCENAHQPFAEWIVGKIEA